MTTFTRPRATLERQAIGFTIGLYLFISLSLLALHYFAPLLPQVAHGEAQADTLSSPSTTVLASQNGE